MCAVEDNVKEESLPGNKPSAVCSESGSIEKPQDTDCEPSKSDVSGSSEAVVPVSEPSDAQAANAHAGLDTDSQPSMLQPTLSNSSAAEMQPEVANKEIPPNVASKKSSQKLNSEVDSMSTEGTWEVSSSDDSSKRNVVLIRRQHPSEIADCGPAESSQSRVSYETAIGTEERTVSCQTDEDNAVQEQVDDASHEPVEDTVNTEATDTDCISTDTPTGDASVSNVDTVPSTDIAQNQSTKRRRKTPANREPSRKSQRCSSRRREADGSVVTTPVSTSAAEAKPAGSCGDAQMGVDENESCLLSKRAEEVSQEQVVSLQTGADVHDKSKPTVSSVSSSVLNQTGLSMESTALHCRNITASCVTNTVQLVPSVPLIGSPDIASESSAKSEPSDLVDRFSVADSSQGHAPLESTYSHISSSGDVTPVGPMKIESALKFEQPQINEDRSVAVKVKNVAAKCESDTTDDSVFKRESHTADSSAAVKVESVALKLESDVTSSNYLASDFKDSSRQSDETSLLNTCLSSTCLETLVSPEEQHSHSSVVLPNAVDGTDKEGLKYSETPSSAASVNIRGKNEGEREEVCKSLLEEVVTSITKDTQMTSASKENVESSSTESSEHPSQNAATHNESDSTSEEIPLKKRRGRRVFANCQSSDVAAPSHQRDQDHSGGISSRHRRRPTSNSSRRRSPRGKKYVGAHTSIVGKFNTNGNGKLLT